MRALQPVSALSRPRCITIQKKLFDMEMRPLEDTCARVCIVDAPQVQTRPERDACEPSVDTGTFIRAATTRRSPSQCKMALARARHRESCGVMKSTALRAPGDPSVMPSEDAPAAVLRSSGSFQSRPAPRCWVLTITTTFQILGSFSGTGGFFWAGEANAHLFSFRFS